LGSLVELICDLSEASDDVFRETWMSHELRPFVNTLKGMGVIEPGPMPKSVICAACDTGHIENLGYDSVGRGYTHFCGKVGFVTVDSADLITHRFRADWLPRWLVAELPVDSAVRPRVIVPECAWHLGDTKLGDTLVTVIFARRIGRQLEVGQLASVLRAIHRADYGVVVTTSLDAAQSVPLPNGYEFIHFPDLVVPRSDRIEFKRDRFASWIRGMQPRTAKGAPTRSGRPSALAIVVKILELRRSRGNQMESDSAEARAILAEWKEHAPDQRRPAFGTVRGHVSRQRKV
jgi:hypothetical protein